MMKHTRLARWKTMPDTKKSILQSNHRSETLYSGFVTVVTHKTIVVFIPALDVEVDVQRNSTASVQNGSVPEVGDIATVQIVLEDGDYAATVATFVPQQDIREDISLTDDDFFDDDLDDEEAEEYDWYNETPAEDFGNLDID